MPNFTDYMRQSQNLLGGDNKTKNEDIYEQSVLLLEMNRHFPEKYREMASASDSEKPSRLSERTSDIGHSDRSDDFRNFQGLMRELSNNGKKKISFEGDNSRHMKYLMLRFFTFSKMGTLRSETAEDFLKKQRLYLKIALVLEKEGRLTLLKEGKRFQAIRRICHMTMETKADEKERVELLDSLSETKVVGGIEEPKFGNSYYAKFATEWNKSKKNPQSVKKIKAKTNDVSYLVSENMRLQSELDIISDKALVLDRALDASHAEKRQLKAKVEKLQKALDSGVSYALKLMSELEEAKSEENQP